MTTRILLTGAGFTRNWGGWLAAEVWEYLIGSPHMTPELKMLLWRHRRIGGYEAALAECQEAAGKSADANSKARLAAFEKALLVMFNDMDAGIQHAEFEFQDDIQRSVGDCLSRFDAIFTLNQDVLLERHYLDVNISLKYPHRWQGWQIPGMRRMPIVSGDARGANDVDTFTPGGERVIAPLLQPYFKLHGSQNWRSEKGDALLVAGGGKSALIGGSPVLSWYQGRFVEYLEREDCRLVVIGYGFGDEHVNRIISDAAQKGSLRLFVVDPLGLDVADKHRDSLIYQMDPYLEGLMNAIGGASRRSVRDIFGNDAVEHGKVMRFLQ